VTLGPAALLTPSLLAETARLRVELADVIERSRDLCWRGRQVCGGEVSGHRMLRGGAPGDDGALLMAIISGVALCQDCISRKSGIPIDRIDTVLTSVASTIVLTVVTRPCAACLETKRAYSLDGAAPHADTERPNGTRHAILNFLSQHAGSAYCAACISAKVFGGREIDLTLRQLEGNGVHRRHDRCSACLKLRLVASLSVPN
jgi:hypothetical protein